jgi:hypothetical protein
MSILKNILPEKLRDTKILHNTDYRTCYCNDTDNIILNKYQLLKNDTFLTALEIYLKEKITKREIIIFALLHELGHRYYIGIKKSANISEYETQISYLNREIFTGVRYKLLYWTQVKEERKAMTFAKRYFKIYRKARAQQQKETTQ